ncbi:tRNA 2-thiouridine(34) synthase MnmA [Desulfonatronovibrio magnus]|uniref:tRNA 2-thiouridine(34) synthase MnmA n=1 Tax=Desulfonatronovibrio magnus TaxID=698827 RepID=UPI0005EB7105|nr:tRNA 2-thiouridine(34) synthase MnmA [Desulfonatronovibrio magnus]
MKTAVALSGGADSLYALLSLHEAGWKLMPVHARFFKTDHQSHETEKLLADFCSTIGLQLTVLDLAKKFKTLVMDPFVQDYIDGLTPNPCVTCNQRIKFGLIMDHVRSLGADQLATGHYARIDSNNDIPALFRGQDPLKDQSYFLSLVPVKVLNHVVFPLQTSTKKNILKLLGEKGITPPVPGESNEVCFIENDYRSFIQEQRPNLKTLKGPIMTTNGTVLGQHQGLWHYTPGQRKGLGIAYKHPLYVIEKNFQNNALIVGNAQEQMSRGCEAKDINIHVAPKNWPETVMVQIRYRSRPHPAIVTINKSRMTVKFLNPQDIAAPGQIAAVYSQHGQVLAAGIITSSKP